MKNSKTLRNIALASACYLLSSFHVCAQWTSLSSGTTSNLHGVFFLNEDTGFVAGGDLSSNSIILKTVNGGITWTTVYSTTTNDYLEAITFINPHHGFVTGSKQNSGSGPILLYTTDGGNTWNSYSGLPTQGEFSAVKFIDTNNGYITGSNLFDYGMKTTDGGNTWSNLASITDDFSTICFVNSSKGFIAPTSGGLLVTSNGGGTWAQSVASATGNIRDIQFTTSTSGIAVGFGSVDPIILRTVNAGSSWNLVASFTNGYLRHVSFPNPQKGFAVGGTSVAPTIISSVDSGSNWSTMTLPINSSSLDAIHFPSVNTGYAVGNAGNILKYHNTTSVSNVVETNSFHVYPNPVTNMCYWSIDNNCKDADSMVSLYSFDGRLVKSTRYMEGKLDVKNLINGMYILKFNSSATLVEIE